MAFIKHISLLLLALCTWAAVRGQLVFDPAVHDFGTIREADGRVSWTFKGVNQGDKPLVILDVISTCGCTVPEYSRQPILPGGKTQITVTFDPMNRPGTFIKELGVYSTERKKVGSLTVRGAVTARPKTTEELYPVDAGSGLRLTSTLCTFSYIHQGQPVQGTIGFKNTSVRTLYLSLLPQQASGLLATDFTQRIAPGEQGEINFSYLIPANNPRYGTIRDAMEVRVDGRGTGTVILAHGIGADAPVKYGESAPKVQLSENMLKFGPVKHTEPTRRLWFTLSNVGDAELAVRAVECGEHIGTTFKAGRKIAPGASCTVDVTLDPRKQDFGTMSDYLILVTNDPARPMRRIRVTAIIEK